MQKRRLPFMSVIALLFARDSFLNGALLIGLGILIFWWFELDTTDYQAVQFWGREKVSVPGRVVENASFKVNEEGSKPDKKVYGFEYYTHDSTQYLRGNTFLDEHINEGEIVEVEYLASKPNVSRIKGGGNEPISLFFVFFAFLPLLGGVYLARKGLIRFARLYTLFEKGLITRARWVGREFLYQSYNGNQIYTLTFEYESQHEKRHTLSIITAEGKKYVDEPKGEPVIYHPEQPEWAMLVDQMPESIRRGLKV